jgi:hypothetical protein
MGEDQVAASALDVEGDAEVLAGDRRALDVPAGAAGPERAVPVRLPVAGASPDDAVERVLLAGPLGVAAPVGVDLEHGVAVVVGLLAERRVRGHGEVVVVLDPVDRPGLLEPLDQGHRERDRLDRADEVVGREHAQGLHVLAEQLGLALGELGPVDVDLGRALEERVVDIGDVLDEDHVVSGAAPGPVQQVEGDVRRGVAHVRGVIRRDAADVEPGGAVGGRRHEARGRSVVQRHRRSHDRELGHLGSRPRTHARKPKG